MVFVCLCWGFTAQSTTRSCRASQLIVVLFQYMVCCVLKRSTFITGNTTIIAICEESIWQVMCKTYKFVIHFSEQFILNQFTHAVQKKKTHIPIINCSFSYIIIKCSLRLRLLWSHSLTKQLVDKPYLQTLFKTPNIAFRRHSHKLIILACIMKGIFFVYVIKNGPILGIFVSFIRVEL